MRCRLLIWMWAGQHCKGKGTRSAAVRAPWCIIAEIMLSQVRFLQDLVTDRRLGRGQMEALHAHLVQRCASLRLCPVRGLQGKGTAIQVQEEPEKMATL